ncbi:hypothetical protein DFJ73DRAFT_768504 [Zopfochytrium polystomum]|nr:hypothetical protein DFJ73DRAFT_768504 [Zopfochytrium polystomum]
MTHHAREHKPASAQRPAKFLSLFAALLAAICLSFVVQAAQGSPDPNPHPLPVPLPAPLPGDKVYRALTREDREHLDAGRGIPATDPNASITPQQHQAGKKPSQYISTTRNEDKVRNSFDSGNGIVKINLNKVPGNKVDMTQHSKANPDKFTEFQRAIMKREKEVLIEGHIPGDACKLVRRDGTTLYRRGCSEAAKSRGASKTPRTSPTAANARGRSGAPNAKNAAPKRAASKPSAAPAKVSGKKKFRAVGRTA